MKPWILSFILILSACDPVVNSQWLEMKSDLDDHTIKVGIGIAPRWAVKYNKTHIALPPPVEEWLEKKDN